MRLTISNKVFFIFSVLSLITILMGIYVFAALQEIDRHTNEIKLLNDFRLQVTELSLFNQNREESHAGHMKKNLEEELAGTEKLIPEIARIKTRTPENVTTPLADLGRYMSYYRKAAIDLMGSYSVAGGLYDTNSKIKGKLFASLSELPDKTQPDFLRLIVMFERHWNDYTDTHDLQHLVRLKNILAEIKKLAGNQKIQSMADSFITNAEKDYFNYLAIEKHRQFLIKTNERFFQVANESIQAVVSESTALRQALVHRILGFIVFSSLLTLMFWHRTSKRVRTFQSNFRSAINSIEAGYYDYQLETRPSADELGEVIIFMKELSASLQGKIEAQKQSEKEQQSLRDQLYQAQRIESIGILAGGVAHDFNNILTGILGYCELALRNIDHDRPEYNHLEMIKQAGLKAESLTKQLLAFSRKQMLEMGVINVNVLIQNLVKMLTRIIGEDIILELNLSPSLRNIRADSTQIEQVLMNLLVNARDAMDGRGKVMIETAEVEFDETYAHMHLGASPGSYVMMAITDSGHGMDRETQNKIFEPFFTTKEKGKGTGLGLATVYGIVKQHHGNIYVYSEPGQGTTFKIYLPVIDDAITPVEVLEQSSNFQGTETILVVDDDETIRSLIVDTLEPYGYKPFGAANGKEALELVRLSKVDIQLLLTDVVMPGMNGKELAETLRKEYPELKVLYMSGYPDHIIDSDYFLVQRNGAVDFLSKPIKPNSLLRKIRDILDRKLRV